MGESEGSRRAISSRADGSSILPVMTNYCEAMLEAHRWLMRERSEVFCIGQGVWSPWYVGNSMRDLEKDFGVERVIDTPVSEAATTSAALGAALYGGIVRRHWGRHSGAAFGGGIRGGIPVAMYKT